MVRCSEGWRCKPETSCGQPTASCVPPDSAPIFMMPLTRATGVPQVERAIHGDELAADLQGGESGGDSVIHGLALHDSESRRG